MCLQQIWRCLPELAVLACESNEGTNLGERRTMPLPRDTELAQITVMLPERIKAYNEDARTASYNLEYKKYVQARSSGIAAAGSLAAWVNTSEAVERVWILLKCFGMDSQGSKLVVPVCFQRTLVGINPGTMNWTSGISLPLSTSPPDLSNPVTGRSLSTELREMYEALATPGAVTASGGYVAASKAMHCLFPALAPMIDGKHSGISYYRIVRQTYTPPLGIVEWAEWLGAPIRGVPNPSPRGGGRDLWDWKRFVLAIGINQHIYELWQGGNGRPGLAAFLALDPSPGTTGIPRIIDKGLW
jgi:hypothetical protein